MTFGIIVWGTCSPSLMKDIERIHVRAAKIIHYLPKHVKWDKIENIYKRKFLSKMHKIFYGECPEVLKSHFTQGSKLDKERKHFTIPIQKKSNINKVYRGPLLWNSLPLNIRLIENFHTFKRSLKRAKESIKTVSFLKEASMIRSKMETIFTFKL